MAKMSKSVDEYAAANGWSSKLFANNAVVLIKLLEQHKVDVKIGRAVIHLEKNGLLLKAYVHYNGRSNEYVTVTDKHGAELKTVHYTDFSVLKQFLFDQFSIVEVQ